MKTTIVLQLLVAGSLLWTVFARAEEPVPRNKTIQKLETTAKASAANMEKVGDIQSGYLNQGASTVVPVQLDRARCYKFIAVGGKGVTNLSLAVNAHGKEVSSDRISGAKLIAEWCSPGRVKVKINLTIYDGSGSYALGVYGAKEGSQREIEKVGGQGSDFIANRVRQLHTQFGKNRAAISPLLRGNLSTGNQKNIEIRLHAGHCYTIIAAGSPSIRNLDIRLLSPTGRELNSDQSKNSYPIVETNPCIRVAGKHTIRVYMFSGFGQFGLQVFSD
ncbi:MAG: hypothetical protein GY762_10045 [Proteobacteria bacterium]|nr:hypothetical protein [Pseudomonadota bacterium]